MPLFDLANQGLTLLYPKELKSFWGYPGYGQIAALSGRARLAYGRIRADAELKPFDWAIPIALSAVALLPAILKHGLPAASTEAQSRHRARPAFDPQLQVERFLALLSES